MSSKLDIKFYFTHRSSPDWPNPSVYFSKRGKYVVGNYYSKDFANVLEWGLDNG